VSRSPIRKTLTPLAAALMQSAIQKAPCSLDALVIISGLAKPVVTRYVKSLRDAKLIHVGSWARDARDYPTIRQFAWGDAPDATCPLTTRTAKDRMRALRAAQKGSEK
jgi:DNA-binding IclR family transcriptional regulator